MYLCHRYTNASLAEIGRLFGRNHTAARNAYESVEREILQRAPLRYQVEELARRVEAERRLPGP
jgi:chromosomal replication initiation ATPase DnaA